RVRRRTTRAWVASVRTLPRGGRPLQCDPVSAPHAPVEAERAIDAAQRAPRCRARPLAWAAVAVQEVVDPGAGPRQRAVGRRHVDLEGIDAIGRLRALVHADPDAGLIPHLAAPQERAAAGAVAHLLGAGLWADVFEVAEHAVAARLA